MFNDSRGLWQLIMTRPRFVTVNARYEIVGTSAPYSAAVYKSASLQWALIVVSVHCTYFE